jgi:hypothetical protein
MSRFALAVLLAPLFVLPACVPEGGPNEPVSQDQFIAARNEYQKQNPDARVGLVTAVLPDDHLASVGSVPVKDFAVGDIVSFIDAYGNIVATGQVEAITNDQLNVRYTPTGGRDPIKGDLAVRAIK